MKLTFVSRFISCCLFFGLPGALPAQSKNPKAFITLNAEEVVDKIRGGMLGQITGNVNGFAYEFKFYEEPGNVENYVPALPSGGQTDDDTDFEWVYIYNMQKTRNIFIPYSDVTKLWVSSINRNIWNANRYARYLMDLGIMPPLTGNVLLNPWAEFNISGQFLSETYGLIAPAMPQTAAKIGLHYTRVAIDDEPAQTTQFYTSMVSTAFVEKDINKIIDAGLASLDPGSIVVQIIADVKKWHAAHPENWKETRRLLHEKYQQKDVLTRNRNGTELNTASIIAALLYGKANYPQTVQYAFNFGYDSDCNAATAGTIIGVMYGYRRMLSEGWQIVDRYKNTNRDNMPMDETITSFSDRLVELFELVNEKNGGSKFVLNKTVVYKIPVEKPAAVIALLSKEQQEKNLLKSLEKEIVPGILSSKRQQGARAAFFAICLNRADAMKTKYPQQWKEALYNLGGYWKVMNNIFYGDSFISLVKLREKFSLAGLQKPLKAAKSDELFTDKEIWKTPGSF